jgi:uncharacterized protein (DUF2267 family)
MATHLDNYAREGNEFLRKVATALGAPEDTDKAFRTVQAVFYALRDRIQLEESMHLIAELPMALKAVYVNNWNPKEKPQQYERKEDFLNEVFEKDRTALIDFDYDGEAEVQAVFSVLKSCVSEGEINHVKGQLPKEIAELMEV